MCVVCVVLLGASVCKEISSIVQIFCAYLAHLFLAIMLLVSSCVACSCALQFLVCLFLCENFVGLLLAVVVVLFFSVRLLAACCAPILINDKSY